MDCTLGLFYEIQSDLWTRVSFGYWLARALSARMFPCVSSRYQLKGEDENAQSIVNVMNYMPAVSIFYMRQ